MRKIEFRGKRTDNGEWVYGSYVKAPYHWNKYGVHEDWIANAIQNGGYLNLAPRVYNAYSGLFYNACGSKSS